MSKDLFSFDDIPTHTNDMEPETSLSIDTTSIKQTEPIPTDAGHEKRIDLYGRNWNKKVFSYQCSIDEGKNPITSNELLESCSPPTIKSHSPLSCSPPTIQFTGECFLCGINGHSQNYCPLKKCESCGEFGHSDKVCFSINPNGVGTTTSNTNNLNNGHNKKTRDYPPSLNYPAFQNHEKPTFKKYEFGSGWKKEKQL